MEKLDLLDYAPALESASIAKIAPSYGNFIDGAFTKPHDLFVTLNPASATPLSEVTQASTRDVDNAVAAARRAHATWSKLPGSTRARYLYRIARLLQERAREFAVLETLDNGKPIRETRDIDVPLAAAHFFYYAGWADKLDLAGFGASPESLGVVGQIIPWNFPLLMAAWKIAPALACGNTVVLKPAETTPLTALLLAEVLNQAELPAGVVNIVTGNGQVGEYLVSHPDIDKVAFTGSTGVGRAIARRLSDSTKRLTLELGGKGANIVFDDAPIDQVIEGIVDGIFFNQGHVCCAGSRLIVQEPIHDELLSRLQRRVEQLRVGNPLDKNTDVGAINSAAQLARINALVEAGEHEGATRFSASCSLPESGFWFAPTIFTNVSSTHRIAREEIFGPVLSVLTFRTAEEAIAKANNTTYGLAAGVWSEKASRTLFVASHLRAGVVWANTYNKFDPTSPFGGVRESGFGREGGLHGLEAYLNV